MQRVSGPGRRPVRCRFPLTGLGASSWRASTVGSRVRCRAATPSHLLLETAGGRTIALERDRARFIQVSAQNPLPQNPLPQNPLHAAEPPENPGATALT